MKYALLAAVAMIAAPALAQTSGTMSGTDPSVPQSTAPGSPPSAPASDTMTNSTSAPAPTMGTSGDTGSTSGTMSTGSTSGGMSGMSSQQPSSGMADPAGGYAPSSNTMGSMTPSQAFPAPAPMANYPVCKPGQYDDCMQASGGSSHRRATRHRH